MGTAPQQPGAGGGGDLRSEAVFRMRTASCARCQLAVVGPRAGDLPGFKACVSSLGAAGLAAEVFVGV